MGAAEGRDFLTHLAVERKVAVATQNQALSALLFLYKEVLRQEVGWLEGVERAKKPVRLPVVLTREGARRIFEHLYGTHRCQVAAWLLAGIWTPRVSGGSEAPRSEPRVRRLSAKKTL